MTYIPSHTNQLLFVQELIKRGISVDTIDLSTECIRCEYKGHVEYLFDRQGRLHNYATSRLMSDKFLSKILLNHHDIHTPPGKIFDTNAVKQILMYCREENSYPVVIKPLYGSHGDNVCINIGDDVGCQETCKKIQDFYGEPVPCIIEKYIPGDEYRIFITSRGDTACVKRTPAYVIGDGVQTIQALIDEENTTRNDRTKYALYPIIIDHEYLSTQGFTTQDILGDGIQIALRQQSNVATGGVTTDCTEIMHPGFRMIAQRALASFPHAAYAGIDLITKDITQNPLLYPYAIIEINSNPSFSIHIRPRYGISRNVAGMVADILFPETASI